jgi:hypothetical protein
LLGGKVVPDFQVFQGRLNLVLGPKFHPQNRKKTGTYQYRDPYCESPPNINCEAVGICDAGIGDKYCPAIAGNMMRNSGKPPGNFTTSDKIIFHIYIFEIRPDTDGYHSQEKDKDRGEIGGIELHLLNIIQPEF